MTETSTAKASTAYLQARLDVVELRVRRAVAVRQKEPVANAAEHAAEISKGLADAEDLAQAAEATGATVRLRSLARAFELTTTDIELLLIALAPELDPRFGLYYGYLHDDAARPHASAGLALELCGTRVLCPKHRARLAADAPLLASGLLCLLDPELPFPARTLLAADRVTSHLLGADRIDQALAGIASILTAPRLPPDSRAAADAAKLVACLASTAARRRVLYLRGSPDSAITDVAAAVAAMACGTRRPGSAVLTDLTRLQHPGEAATVLLAAVREARVREIGLVAGPVERLPRDPAQRAMALRGLACVPVPVVLTGSATWDARWSDRAPLLAAIENPDRDERDRWWRDALRQLPGSPADGARALTAYRLSPRQMRASVDAASVQAAAEQRPVTTSDLLRGARHHNAAELEELARRVRPSARWDDLVLVGETSEQLLELAGRHRDRDTVLRDWRLRPAHGSSGKVTALFTGESGTGKTLAAEVLAGQAGIDLYVINLATVVDKYVGETEKNLERIFAAAASVQGMLFFDEADALFGKRTKVTDAHDRFANIEVAYLLQRLEAFDGLAILATNLSGSVDQAFLRRLDAIIHFPRPAVAERARLWDVCLGPSVPRSPELDLAPVAAAFELTGGSIRSCALTAAYQAARTGHPVTTAALHAAVRHEYRKLGRIIDETQFA